MEFSLLGPLLVRSGGVVMPVQQGKQRAVLAALLLSANQVVSVDDLAEALWGHEPPPSARATVQNYIVRLRKALRLTDGSRICTWPRGYLIRVDPDELDVAQFEAMLRTARTAARDGSWGAAAAQARAALSLWRGDPLADVDSDLLAAREVPRLTELRLQAMEVRIDADLHLGRHSEVIAELRRLAAEHPLRERLHGMLMLALYRDGRQAEALAAYHQARTVLVNEIGTEPGTDLRVLQHQILTGDSSLQLRETEQLAAGGPAPQELPAHPVSAKPEVPASLPRSWKRALPMTTWVGLAIVGAILAATATLGVLLTSSGGGPAAGSAGIIDPRLAGNLGPVCGSKPPSSGRPTLCVTQPQGDPTTYFTVRESGFKSGTDVTLTVIFFPPPPKSGPPPKPVMLRTFTVTANRSFWLGPFQRGLYQVIESGAGAARPSTSFRVVPIYP